MIVNYNSLRSGRDTWLKNGIGDLVGSPPGSAISKFAKPSWMVMLVMLLMMAFGQQSWAQTTLINPTGNGGFENGTTFAANNWTAVNSTTDSWVVGSTPGVTAGTKCAFVSSTPTGAQTWTYSQLSVIQHVYYDVTIPAGEPIANLSFKWKAGGEGTTTSDWDNMKVFWGTVANVGTPVANTAVSATYQVSGNGATSGMYKLSSAAYGTSTIGLSGVPGTTYRLVFSWKSDVSDIANPPAAIDEVSLVSAAPASFTAVQGGLWSSPATWSGGVVPGSGNDVTIPAGIIVTVDGVYSYRNMTVNGTVQWNATANTMTLGGNLNVGATGSFLAYTSAGAGVTVNVAGNYQNDGYSNFALSSLVFNGSGSTLSGTGIFQGDGTRGIIRSLNFSNLGSNSVTTTQTIATTFGMAHTGGSLSTGGKIALDNTAQIYGLPYNLQVASTVVTAMGTGYTVAPVAFGAAVTQWTNITGSVNTLYVSGNNVYRCTTAANIGPSAPTHTSGISQNLLWIGTRGTLGNAFLGAQSHTAGTQYFYGGNLYVCTVTGVASITAPPTHTSGSAASGAATFRYIGTPATVTPNFDSATGTVRSLNLTSAGSGYSSAPSIVFSVGVAGGAGSGAAASAVYFQQVAYTTNAFSTFQKSGGAATISGGLTINSDQGVSATTSNPQASSGVGSIATSNGGVNYTVAPLVGFAGPTALNLILNPGSGYAAAPTITVSGGTLVSGTALTSSNFTITVNNGTVESVYLNSSTTACYSVPPTLTMSAGTTTATLAFPSGCWPAATANIGSNGQITSFTITSPGFGYVAVPTLGVGTTSGTAAGGTFTTVATAPVARIGLYNLTLNFFSPATSAVVNGDDAAIPSNRKINTLTLAGNGNGINLSSGGLTLFGSSPLSLTAGLSTPGNIIDMGGNPLTFTWNGYGGTSGVYGGASANTYVKNGSISFTGRGGGSTFTFPFAGTFTWFAGSGSNATGSSVTNITATETAAPSNASVGTGLAIGNKAYRVQFGQIGGTGFTSTPVTGTGPTVTLTFNALDGLTVTQDQLFVSESTALTGAWNTKSTAYGASGALPASGSKATTTVSPGPIAPTSNSYYAFSTSAPTITSVSPTTVCSNSGAFTITGTNLTGVTAVTIGGTAVTSFVVTNATTITGVAGNGTDGFVAITKSGVTVTGTQSITVSPSPTAPMVSPASASVVLGGTVNLTATGGAGIFNWYNVATGGSPIFTGATYSAPACATSTLYVSENNGSCDGARTAVPVTVQATTITASIPTFCGTGGTTTLTASPTDPGITYTWSSTTGSFNTTTGNSVDLTVSQSSDVTVTATNGSCTATKTTSISVYPLPSATVTTSASGVCPGTSATINSGLSAGNFTATCITAPSALSTPPSGSVVLCNGGATVVALSGGSLDDGYWNALPMGFSFNYFGTSYSTLNVGTNGTVNFGAAGSTQYSFTGGFPNTANPANTIAVCARDLQLNATGGNSAFGRGTVTYWTEGVAPNRRFIVQYANCTTWYSTTATDGINNTEAVFYETTGVVDIRVIRASNPTATTGSFINDTRNKFIGLQDGTRTIGATAPNCSTSVANYWNGVSAEILTPQAWRFQPPSHYTTTWTAYDNVTMTTTTLINAQTDVFSLSVTPTNTTTYTISYTNQTTGCTNAPNSAQVTMNIISNVAPTTAAQASPATVCNEASTTLSLDYTGSTSGLTFQWQVSTDGGATWTNIAGATGATTTVTPTVASQYRNLVTSCSGSPLASAPVTVTFTNNIDTTTGATRCGTGPVSLSATTLSTGASIKWYAAATGGTALFTGSPYNIASIAATTTYYVAAETTGCSSPRVPVTATVTTPPAFSIGATSATICNGSTSAVFTDAAAGANYDTFTISPNTGIASSNLSGVFSASFNPTATTTYTITASQSAGSLCNTTISFTVTVNSANVTPASSASAVCLGSSVNLSATSLGLTTGPQTSPTGYLASNATSTSDEDILNVTFGSLNNSSTCATTGGGSSILNEYSDFTALTAPTVNAGATVPISIGVGTCGGSFSNFTNVYIDYNRNGNFDASELAYSSAGAPTGAHTETGSITIPTTALAGVTRMRVFVVEFGSASSSPTGTYTWGETEDYNVNIVGVGDATNTYSYAWTSNPVGFTASTATTTATPTETTIYYVTATSPQGCTASGSVTVTVNTDPVANITGGATSICLGSPTVPAVIDFDSTVGALWSSSNTAVATVNGNGVVTPLSAGTTIITARIENPTTGCTTYAANPQTVMVYSPLAITSQPSSLSVLDYDGTNTTTNTFSVTASGSVTGYQWQVSPTGVEGSFSDLANGGFYSGVTTSTLTITNATTAISGLYYRAVVSGNSPCASPVSSNAALLTVSDVSITADPVFGAPICTSGDRTITVGVSGPTGTSVVWQYSDDNGSTWTTIEDTTPIGALTITGDVTSTSLELHNITSVNNGWLIRAAAVSGETVVFSNPTTIVVNQSAVVNTGSPVQNATVCNATAGTATFTVSATGATGYQWQYSNDGSTWAGVANGTPTGATYSNATTASLTVNVSSALVAGPHYYRAMVNSATSCPAQYSNVAQLLINTPTVNVTASSTLICNPGGTAVTLTANGTAATYSWSPSTGLSATTGASVTANPTVTTTYTVTGTETGGCTGTAQVTITVGAAVIATATATPGTICPGANSQLVATVTNALTDTAANYSFARSAAPYVALTGDTPFTVNAGTGSLDDGYSASQPIGFSFTLAGNTFTDFTMNTNGFLVLGGTPSAGAVYSVFSSTDTNVISFNNRDLHNTGAAYSYVVEGTSPNQICKIQAKNFFRYNTPADLGNAQIWLYETSNKVEMHYGSYAQAWTSGNAYVGLKGATSSDVRSISSATWAAVTSASASTSTTGAIVQATTNQVVSGTVYTFTPPVINTYTYAWSPSTFIAGQENLPNPVATGVTATTVYTVTITSNNGCNTTQNVTVNIQSGASITTQPVAATVCQGATATFSVVANGAGLTYQWYDSTGAVTGATSATLTLTNVAFASSGSTYYVIVTPSCGAPVTSDTVVLTVNPTPTATAPAAFPTTCSGATTAALTLNGTPSGVTFDITGGAAIGLANQTGVTAIPSFTAIAGTATLSITPKANGCTGTAITYAITISALPTAVSVTPATATRCSSDANAILLTGSGGAVPPASYCTPTVALSDGTDFINNFSFGGIVNNGTGQATAQYAYYSALTANVTAGVSTPLSIQSGSGSAQQFGIWIDLNQNGTFDTNEFVALTTTGTTAVVNASITVPTTALNGITRMRVAARFSTAVANNTSCSNTGYGEYEDYKVSITGATNPPALGYVWTSTGGGLYTDLAGTIPYTGTASSTVYAKPGATATVTATYTNAAGCTASGTSVITVNNATTYYADADGDTYGNLAVTAMSCTGAPAGYVTNSTDCDDTNPAKYQSGLLYIDADGDGYTAGQATVCYGAAVPSGYSATSLGTDCNDNDATLTTNCTPASSIVNVKMFIQGYYFGSGTMASVMFNQSAGVLSNLDVEMMSVELHDATTFGLVASATAMLHTDGTLSAAFTTAPSGSYYVVVKGRNMVQTWSAAPQTVGSTPLLYDFTTAASQAYGDNMAEVEPGVFAMYSGEFNADDFVEYTDYTIWETDANNFAEGDYATDLNGDGFVEYTDYTIWETNAGNFVSAIYPF